MDKIEDSIEERLAMIDDEAALYKRDAERELGVFVWVAGVLIFVVPALSVAVTILTQTPNGSQWAFGVSALVSVLSVFNSAFKPTARYSLGSSYANKFWLFTYTLKTEFATLRANHAATPNWTQVGNEFLTEKAKELAMLVDAFNRDFFEQFAPMR